MLLAQSGIPVVQAMDMTDDPIDLNVGFDHRAAGTAAVRYLHELGHRRIGAPHGHHRPALGAPAEGYLRAMAEFGLSTKGLVAIVARVDLGQARRRASARGARACPVVTAVFACNDDLALGALFECQRRGIACPSDVAIVGFNDLDFASGPRCRR